MVDVVEVIVVWTRVVVKEATKIEKVVVGQVQILIISHQEVVLKVVGKEVVKKVRNKGRDTRCFARHSL